MKTRSLTALCLLAGTLPSLSIGLRDAWINGLEVAAYDPFGFDNDAQTDPVGSEDDSTTLIDVEQVDFGTNWAYNITFRSFQTLSPDLGEDGDVGIGDRVSLKFEVFPPSFQKFSYARFTGANLTSFKYDDSLTVESYPYVEFEVEPVEPSLSFSNQLGYKASLSIRLQFDSAFDLAPDYGQSVIVTDALEEDIGEPAHSSSALDPGPAFSFAGMADSKARFQFIASQTYVDRFGASFEDMQGAINGHTPPAEFSYEYQGDPADEGITVDLGTGNEAETYGRFRIGYRGWDGFDDVQWGLNYAPRDQDSDGLPDGFEDANGMDKTVKMDALATDKDMDGSKDYHEYLNGTDPSDPTSKLQFLTPQFDGSTGDFNLEWSSVTGKLYELRYWPEGEDDFIPLPGAEAVPASGGTTTTYTHENARDAGGVRALYSVGIRVAF